MAPLGEFQRAPSAKVSSKESMKTAILEQEAIFRQQVHELHRLYGVQKQLMSNAKNTPPQNLQQQESDLELTLATGGRRTRRAHASCKSDSATSSSSSSSGSGGSKLACRSHGPLRVPDSQPRMRNETISFDLGDEKWKGRVLPPWMLPCLSLRMSR